jgi:hypothetical protein
MASCRARRLSARRIGGLIIQNRVDFIQELKEDLVRPVGRLMIVPPLLDSLRQEAGADRAAIGRSPLSASRREKVRMVGLFGMGSKWLSLAVWALKT